MTHSKLQYWGAYRRDGRYVLLRKSPRHPDGREVRSFSSLSEFLTETGKLFGGFSQQDLEILFPPKELPIEFISEPEAVRSGTDHWLSRPLTMREIQSR